MHDPELLTAAHHLTQSMQALAIQIERLTDRLLKEKAEEAPATLMPLAAAGRRRRASVSR